MRTPDGLDDLIERHPDRVHAVTLDVRDRSAVSSAVDAAARLTGRLDVVVNNAGYGLVGAIEEIGEEDARAIIDTDLLGALWVTQAALPHLREQGSGHVVQISTVGGVGTMPAFGLYNAAKWGLEAFSEALASEVRDFGIRVTIAELDGFATDWAGASLRFADPIAAYDRLRTASFGSAEVPWPAADPGAGDEPPPSEAAAAILAHIDAGDGPLRLLVGENSPTYVAMALDLRRQDYELDDRFTWPEPPGAASEA